ncbi:helix-turn-helix domain-containing protein [Streptomyces exfoliatus]|uniref:helix-turn-helix domain-containing protein n=1 Tax=Streptomyces exfoliatus TaxID=1905 RepID=UPI00046600AB|nr:helix-turn-helix domain-containing protein [Streptomyces exfoliatus]
MAADRPDDQEPARALGRALRDLQRRSGRTLRDLETTVRISDSSLSRYFLGSTVPPWSTVRDLCKALGGDPSEYRHLWEAADHSQRKPVRRQPAESGGPVAAGGPVTARAPAEGAGTEETSEAGDGDGPSDGAPPEAARRRLSPRRKHVAWAVAGAVIGLAIGAAGAVLLRPQAPASGGAAPAGAQGASAASDVPRIFVSRATGACLDDSLDQGTRSFACNGMSYQRWNMHTTADGGTQLRNHATGECLDHLPGGLATTACGASASQRWTVTARDDVAVEVRSTTARRCLADSAGGLRVLPCDGTTQQKWA